MRSPLAVGMSCKQPQHNPAPWSWLQHKRRPRRRPCRPPTSSFAPSTTPRVKRANKNQARQTPGQQRQPLHLRCPGTTNCSGHVHELFSFHMAAFIIRTLENLCRPGTKKTLPPCRKFWTAVCTMTARQSQRRSWLPSRSSPLRTRAPHSALQPLSLRLLRQRTGA